MINIYILLATLGPIGYLPAPGTMASLLTAVILWFIIPFYPLNLLAIIFILLGSLFITYKSLAFYNQKDPSCIVIDEVAGMSVALLMVPHTAVGYMLAFIFFRLFDIGKFPCIHYLEKLSGAWGVVLDDVAAGLLGGGLAYGIISFLKL